MKSETCKHRKLFIVVSRLPEPRQEERKDSVQLFFIKALSARFRSSGRGAAFFRISKMVHRSLFITGAVDFHVLKSQEKELFPYLRLKPENPPQMNRFHFN